MKIVLFICLGCILLILPRSCIAFDRYNKTVCYDHYFSKYSKRYFGPGFDWKYFKAQAIAESRLKPEAKSYVGAIGVMQIMPATFAEIKRKDPKIKGISTQPKWNISAGIFYNRSIWKMWKADRPFTDRLNFMFGSYNAGKGNILKAQKRARNAGLDPNLWESIVAVLPKVTGRFSNETIGYVKKINTIKKVLK